MNINQLFLIVERKIKKNILLESIKIEDKTFLHKRHKSYQDGKFHLKLNIKSLELKKMNKIQSTRKIYSILNEELKKYIHSIQILIMRKECNFLLSKFKLNIGLPIFFNNTKLILLLLFFLSFCINDKI